MTPWPSLTISSATLQGPRTWLRLMCADLQGARGGWRSGVPSRPASIVMLPRSGTALPSRLHWLDRLQKRCRYATWSTLGSRSVRARRYAGRGGIAGAPGPSRQDGRALPGDLYMPICRRTVSRTVSSWWRRVGHRAVPVGGDRRRPHADGSGLPWEYLGTVINRSLRHPLPRGQYWKPTYEAVFASRRTTMRRFRKFTIDRKSVV